MPISPDRRRIRPCIAPAISFLWRILWAATPYRTADELDEAIKEAEQACAAETSVLTALKHRRDRWLAHLDKKTIRDPE
jgi:hypothetical protein